jgi:hypothetical protein
VVMMAVVTLAVVAVAHLLVALTRSGGHSGTALSNKLVFHNF